MRRIDDEKDRIESLLVTSQLKWDSIDVPWVVGTLLDIMTSDREVTNSGEAVDRSMDSRTVGCLDADINELKVFAAIDGWTNGICAIMATSVTILLRRGRSWYRR
jgi:hypothetical protein